ncbi:hypothetical protein BD309DRAFT_567105 [Dichomitus squalens]|nr:hypothetical protein BD309DRAFT_567105 [Dichomitus squalens]
MEGVSPNVLTHNGQSTKDQVLVAIISSLTTGCLTLLSAVALYLLIQRNTKQATSKAIIFAVVAMYISGAGYWIYVLQNTVYTLDQGGMLSNGTRDGLQTSNSECYASALPVCLHALSSYHTSSWELRAWARQMCVGTATLSINVTLGDAIVWWRVCVICGGHRSIYMVGFFLLAATCAMSVVNTVHVCGTWNLPSALTLDVRAAASSRTAEFLFSGLKAWKYRRTMRSHLSGASYRTRVGKVMALLVESGVIYIIIWLPPVVYLLRAGNSEFGTPFSNGVTNLDLYLFIFVQGGLSAFVSMYPMSIIILVALNKSQWEAHLTDGTIPVAPEIPLHHIQVTLHEVSMGQSGDANREILQSQKDNLSPE